jgi:hypothetical protein
VEVGFFWRIQEVPAVRMECSCSFSFPSCKMGLE